MGVEDVSLILQKYLVPNGAISVLTYFSVQILTCEGSVFFLRQQLEKGFAFRYHELCVPLTQMNSK